MEIREEIVGALASGYCSKRNENKILDPDLIEDMAIQVEKLLSGKIAKEPEYDLDKVCEWLRENHCALISFPCASNPAEKEIKQINLADLCHCDYGDTDRITDHLLTLATKINENTVAINQLRAERK